MSAVRELTNALPPHLGRWAPQLVAASLCYDLDAFLLAAIVDRESGGGEARGYAPKGAAGRGDAGHGHGLAQIDDRSHGSFLLAHFDGQTGQPLWQDPAFNLLYAAKLLRARLNDFGRDTACALAAYNAGPRRVRQVLQAMTGAPREALIAALDSITTEGPSHRPDYVSDVLARRDRFLTGGFCAADER